MTAEPSGGTFDSPQSVMLTASESTTTIYYTTDSSDPTTSSCVFRTPTISEDTVLEFFARDNVGNESPVVTEVYTVVLFPVTHMSDTTASFGLVTHSDTPSHVEFVSPTSQLVGKSIDHITVKLRKTSTPEGSVEAGIFNSDLSVKKLFGTIDATAVASVYADYTISLPDLELYTIEAGDRIGIKFADGDSSNFVAIMTDQYTSDPFDGANTYYQTYTNDLWHSATAKDLYMIPTQTHG
ncbi:MAG TPA: chitobiase/beta-hexosaminidase C-terminal domain-containing protein [Nitrososphaera sp.]|nr:chitobiase/beta-hexosaminidase C-terminal domain-containing protein [Nitrososphaera sp.]